MKKRTRRKYKLFFMALFMCAAFSLLRSNVFAAETYKGGTDDDKRRNLSGIVGKTAGRNSGGYFLSP